MKRALLKIVVGIGVGAVLLGCGKKAEPRAPDEIAPAPIQTFTIAPEEKGVALSWQAPTTDSAGDELVDLVMFEVRRSLVEKSVVLPYETIAEVPLTALDPATGRFVYRDGEIIRGKRYNYTVVPVNKDGVKGAPSNVLRLTFVGRTTLVESF